MRKAFTTAVVVFLSISEIPLVAQTATSWLPGRVLVKMIPDYLRPRIYALNESSGTNNGTLLALNSTNGSTVDEISLEIDPTDMAMTPAGDALYVINTGSRTISKVNLRTFSVESSKAITTPNSYNALNPLHIAVGNSNVLYYTDGAWAPSITTFDYSAGTNISVYDDGNGAGGIAATRDGKTVYRWVQYGWGAGSVNSWLTRFDATGTDLEPLEDSFASWRRDPIDTPIFLDAAGSRVFNKQQMFAATNVSVLLTEFAENIYGISFDGSLAFGPTKIFNTQNGIALTNFTLSTTVQCLSGDQKELFRYRSSTSDLFIYDMNTITSVSGPEIRPTPANGAVVGQAPTNLLWSVSPIALAYDVYFGTNQAQVNAATTGAEQYIGRVSMPGKPAPQILEPGSSYFWRVDVIGFNSTNTGPVWSFTVSPLTVSPSEISVGGIAGFNPSSVDLNLTSATTKEWTASVADAGWVVIGPTNGNSPATVTATFDTATLAAGLYTNQINIEVDGLTVRVPVRLDIKPLNITRMVSDYQRPFIYALQAPIATGQNGQLLFISTDTGNIEKTLPIGINPVDLTIHYGEDRLYIASWTENATYVVDLTSQTLLPPLHLGTDVYKINAGQLGQLVTEGEDQWITASLINTTNGATVATAFFREGDGEMDPTGRFYYHVDNNISSAGGNGLRKYDLSGNGFLLVKSAGGHLAYGSRNLLLSPDGTHVFWAGAAYDADINELGYLGQEIYATTAHGDLAFGSTDVFNVSNGQKIYPLPFSTTVIAVSGDQEKVFLFNNAAKQLVSIPMSSTASVPSAGLNPNPANGVVVNLPVTNLDWTPGPFALSYRVFFGTDESAVAGADTNSPLYLGATASTSMTIPALNSGQTYFWRVDSVGLSATTTGSVWSFIAAPITVAPQSLSFKAVAGLPILPQTISIDAGTGVNWSLDISQPWLSASNANGMTPSTVAFNFDTTKLPAGTYTNELTFTANGVRLQIPVNLQIFNLNVSKMVADPKRDMIYALHPGAGGIDDSFLIFLNTETGVVEKVLPIGSHATDLAVHPREDRLYVSNWQRSQTRVVDLKTRTELPSLSLGTDVFKINAGLAGRIIVEQEDQWINATLVDTANGATLATMFVREGDGEPDPTGRYYYHVGNNSSGEQITKYDTGNNSFIPVASAPKHNGYGSRNLVMSMDGSRLFWTAAMYDANLFDFGVIGSEIYSCSTNGAIAFSASQAYDTAARQVIYTLPVSSTVQIVDRRNDRLWYFNSANGHIESILMAEIRTPSITQQPEANTSIGIGGNVFLNVTAMGLGPLDYQWTMKGTNLPGATNSFLSMNEIEPSQEGDYQVRVSNPYGAVTSLVAHVSVLVPPAITGQPESTKVSAGQPFSLSVAATGSAPLGYQWSFEGNTIFGATNSMLTIANAQSINQGIYRAVVQNSAGSATSIVANVRVVPSGPFLISEPASVTIGASSNVVFNVVATGSQPLFYKWYFKDVLIPGATTAQYSLEDAQASDAGNYHVVVWNSTGSIASTPAMLTVTPVVPYFVMLPIGATLPAGTNFTLAGLARGSEPISYQWQLNGTNILGTNSSLSLTNLTFMDGGAYAVLASNIAGISTSIVASVIVTAAPPVFVEQPASVSLLVGSQTTLNSLASGSTPLSYQWFYENSPIPGRSSRQITLESITLASAGAYYVIASNIFGVATSLVARVTVNQPPIFELSLSNQVVDAGATVTLAVSARGNAPLLYSWQFNGEAMAQTNATVIVTNIQPAQAGYYRVTASNSYGELSSTGRVSVLGPRSGIRAWGDNSGGQTNLPSNFDDIVAVAGGDYHTLALHHDGTLTAWGYNADGQTAVPTNALRFVSIAAGTDHNLALLEDGTVIAWGRNDFGQVNVPDMVGSVLAIAAGESDSIALLASGKVVCWGDDTYGEVSGSADLTGIKAIAAGRIHNLALRADGTVLGWGYNGYGETTPPESLRDAVAIAAGYLHSVALRSNGTVIAWGDNTFGQTNVPANLSNVVAIAAGDFHTYALKTNGQIVSWGDNTYQQTDAPVFVLAQPVSVPVLTTDWR
jgi:hypothetical protein